MLRRVAVCGNFQTHHYCGVLRCVAVCYGVLRYVAVCCGVLQCGYVAVCCGVLRSVAECCGVLQRVHLNPNKEKN